MMKLLTIFFSFAAALMFLVLAINFFESGSIFAAILCSLACVVNGKICFEVLTA